MKTNHINRNRFSVDLLPQPETVGALTLLGAITRQAAVTDPLLTDGQGGYFAQTPRGLEPLKPSKVEAAIREAKTRI